MKGAVKWVSIIVGGLIVLAILALLLIPLFVDIQKYKPEIEKIVSRTTGRPFTLAGDLSLSLFPWAGVSFTDLHLGNPPGFSEKDFLSIKSFEARVKLIPLISRDIQVKRFIIVEPRIILEKGKDGRGNWEGLGKQSDRGASPEEKGKDKPQETKPGGHLPIKTLAVGEFAIKSGSALWIDQQKDARREIKDVTLRLKDVSLDRPIQLSLSADLDGNPLSLKGSVGPLGKEPGKGIIPLDLAISALKQITIRLTGKLIDPASEPKFDLAMLVSPFSPRKLMAALKQSFPITTSDPKALDLIGLKARLKGDTKDISVSDGIVDIDQSKLNFSLRARDFSKPDVTFDLNLDQIDVDRYLPPAGEKKSSEKQKEAKGAKGETMKTDYTPLRRLILDGTARVGKLKASGINIQDIFLKITGKNGVFDLKPLTLKLYQGGVKSTGRFDARRDIPKSSLVLNAEGIQVGPLLKDLLKKEFLEGTLQSDININMSGDDPALIKKTLNGKGNLIFKDGAIVGIDLAGMVRNVKATFGLAEKGAEKPRTDFSEFHTPFTITNGLVNTNNTRLLSPLIRVNAKGKADLVLEALDFRVEPKFVASIKGQGDTAQRSGIMVPVIVSGTFSEPKFRPDLKAMFKEGLEKGITDPDKFKEMIKGKSGTDGSAEPIEEKAKGMLKGFLGK
ncbi:AsmA family protein [Thermodesulfobacteriota bacterium]